MYVGAERIPPMSTNEAEQQQVQREGTFGHMFKRFTSLAILVAILGGGYNNNQTKIIKCNIKEKYNDTEINYQD